MAMAPTTRRGSSALVPSVPRILVLVAALGATTVLTVVLGVADPDAPMSYPSRFLIWNLFLAWIPLVAALGFAVVRSRLTVEFGAVFGWLVMAATVALCAIGVAIGRFQRWNSWDLVNRPDEVVSATLGWVANPFSSVQSTGVGIAVAASWPSPTSRCGVMRPSASRVLEAPGPAKGRM